VNQEIRFLTKGKCSSRRGVFAIGDVRSSSVKRVAAAVGEGAQVVATLHAFLATADQGPARRTFVSDPPNNEAAH
jgi:thioredoxin reductase